MPFIPNNFGQVTHIFEIPGPGSPAMVTYGIADNPIQTPDAIAGFAAAAYSDSTSMITMLDTNASLVETRVLIRRSGDLLAGADFTIAPGTTTGDANPPQVALLFQKQTGLAGRNRRGRMYLPACPDVTESGIYPPATVTLFDARAADFLALLSSAGIDMQLLHVNPADTPNPITALVAVGTVATQRRRIR